MQPPTNWYYEKQGVSQGPLAEEAMIDLLRHKQIAAETLVWNPGLEEWAGVGRLKPEWLKAVQAAPATVRAAKPQAPMPIDSNPPTPLARPKAGIEPDIAEPQAKEQRGFLQRLFGFGKKKK